MKQIEKNVLNLYNCDCLHIYSNILCLFVGNVLIFIIFYTKSIALYTYSAVLQDYIFIYKKLTDNVV